MAAKKKTKKNLGARKTAKTAKAVRPPSKKRKATIPESQRRTERVVLRLEPDVAARLRTIAGAWHVTLAEVVTDALDALARASK